MIDYSKTRLDHFSSRPAPAAPNHGIVEDGQALVAVNDGSGKLAVKAATGGAGEKFFGIAILEAGRPTRLPGVITVVGTGALQTALTTIANYVNGTASVYSAAGVKEADETNVAVASDGKVTVKAAADEGEVFTIRYSYSPTVGEAQMLYGEQESQISPLAVGAQPGVFKHGLIYVSNYDTTQEWAINDVPTLGANGIFTKGGSGGTATGAVVAEIPSLGQPYLGLEISL